MACESRKSLLATKDSPASESSGKIFKIKGWEQASGILSNTALKCEQWNQGTNRRRNAFLVNLEDARH